MEHGPRSTARTLLPSQQALLIMGVAGMSFSALFLYMDQLDQRVVTFVIVMQYSVVIVPWFMGAFAGVCAIIQWLSNSGPKARDAAWIGHACILFLVVAFAQIPCCIYDWRKIDHAQRRIMDWCESLVPRLEAWHKLRDSYPTKIEELGPDVVPPTLFRSGVIYKTTTIGFYFDVPDPTEVIFPTGYAFDSTSREWKHYH